MVTVGMVTTLASRDRTAVPQPMPNAAVNRGRPTASSDPNAISRMTAAVDGAADGWGRRCSDGARIDHGAPRVSWDALPYG
ncbi:MAG: hypothetical protein ACRD29_06050 [Acidimicrobiales bacterium]